jgi:hypothetical protein
MTEKAYFILVGTMFAVGALVHLVHLIIGYQVVIMRWPVPLWASGIGLIVSTALAYYGLQFGLARNVAY